MFLSYDLVWCTCTHFLEDQVQVLRYYLGPFKVWASVHLQILLPLPHIYYILWAYQTVSPLDTLLVPLPLRLCYLCLKCPPAPFTVWRTHSSKMLLSSRHPPYRLVRVAFPSVFPWYFLRASAVEYSHNNSSHSAALYCVPSVISSRSEFTCLLR